MEDLDKLSIIHISGTKGKVNYSPLLWVCCSFGQFLNLFIQRLFFCQGSTCAFCESILRHKGFKTGFYRYRENLFYKDIDIHTPTSVNPEGGKGRGVDYQRSFQKTREMWKNKHRLMFSTFLECSLMSGVFYHSVNTWLRLLLLH